MSVEDCLAHKWLAEESPLRPLAIEPPKPVEEVAELTMNGCTQNNEAEQEVGNCCAMVPTQEDEIKADASIRSDEEDDDQSEECTSSSDKENSLVFNHTMSCSSSSSQSSHSSSEGLFPDAPTTPKVLRKAPSETSPSVKALVKKFQVDSVQLHLNNAVTAAAATTVTKTVAPSPSSNQQSACFVSQIPKLVNSPKSTYSGNINNKYSPSSLGSSPRHVANVGLALRPKLFNVEGRFSDGSPEKSRKSASSAMVKKQESVPSPTATEQSQSPSSRYNPIMACVICGEFVCCHQTTNTVPRKSLLSMDQRITC